MASTTDTFRCYLVEKDASGNVSGRIAERRLEELLAGRVIGRFVVNVCGESDEIAGRAPPLHGFAGPTRPGSEPKP